MARAWPVSLVLLLSLESFAAPAGSADDDAVPSEPRQPENPETRSGYEDVPKHAGPTSAGARLSMDDLHKAATIAIPGWSDRLGDRWFAWKKRVFENHGMAFGVSYNALGQTYDGRSHTKASGGVFDAVLSWTLRGHGTDRSGTLVLLLENQHAYGSVSPELAGQLAGSALPTASFADTGWHLNNLYWSQQLGGDRVSLVAGIVDTTDYVDHHALNDPLLSFASYAFSGTPTMPQPDPGAGLMLRAASDRYYVSAGIADGTAVAGDADFGGFFRDSAHFSHLEVGVTPSFADRFVENAHVTLWHQASNPDAGMLEDYGAALTLSTRYRERTVAFARVALSRGRTTLTDQAVSLGAAYLLRSFDRIGAAVSWANTTVGDSDQVTLEGFYRFQFGPLFTLTPHLQLIFNPALTPEASTLVVAGLRMRISL